MMRSREFSLILFVAIAALCSASQISLDDPVDFLSSVPKQNLRIVPTHGSIVKSNPPSFWWSGYRNYAPGVTFTLALWANISSIEGQAPDWTFNTPYNYINIPQTLPVATDYLWQVKRTNTTSNTAIYSRVRKFFLAADATPYVIPSNLLSTVRSSARPRLLMKGTERQEYLASATGAAFKKRLARIYSFLNSKLNAVLPPAPTQTIDDFPPGSVERTNFINSVMYQYADPQAFAISNYIYAVWYDPTNTTYVDEIKRRTMHLALASPNGATNQTSQDLANRLIMLSLTQSLDLLWNSYSSTERTTLINNIVNRADQIFADYGQFTSLLTAPHDSHGANTLGYMAVMSAALLGDVARADAWATSIPMYFNLYSAWGSEEGGFGNGLGYGYWDAMATTSRWDFLKWATRVVVADKQFAREWPLQFVYFAPHGSQTGGLGFGDGGDLNMVGSLSATCVNMVSRVLDRHPDIYEAELYQYYCSQANLKLIDYRYYDLIWSSDIKNVTQLTKSYPKSIHMKNIGWAAFHSSMEDANRTALFFRSSKYGDYNHNSAEQLCFTMMHKSQPMLISSGYYDSYFSPHHKNWRKTTRAQSGGITMDGGLGQGFNTMEAFGTISQYGTSDQFDYVTGEAVAAYNAALPSDSPLRLTRATRSLIYLRGVNQFLIMDRVDAVSPRMFEWNIHANSSFSVVSPSVVQITQNGVSSCINMLHSSVPFTFWQTDQFPANAQVNKPNQWHGQFKMNQNVSSISFVVLIDPDCTGHVPDVTQSGSSWELSIGELMVDWNGDQLTFTGPPSVLPPNESPTGGNPNPNPGTPSSELTSRADLMFDSLWKIVFVLVAVMCDLF